MKKEQDHIVAFFNDKFPFNQEGLQEFSSAFKTKNYKKGTMIASKDDLENQLRFLEKGTIREFYSHEGKEMNTWFYLENEFITDFNELLKGGTRNKYQKCLTDTIVRTMDRTSFFQFMDKYQCGKEFVHEIFRKIISLREEEEFKYFSLSPDELYLDLLQNRAEWVQQIPLYHIASYLRMTPETLSRIRKRN